MPIAETPFGTVEFSEDDDLEDVAAAIQQHMEEFPDAGKSPEPRKPAPVYRPPNLLTTLIRVEQGLEMVVRELQKPVVPKYDDKGKLIGAQRVG